MGVLKTYPVTKFINGEKVETSDVSIVTSSIYTTTGESSVIIKGEGAKTVILNHETTDHITVKALTDNVLIKTTKGLIDAEYEEIEIHDRLFGYLSGWLALRLPLLRVAGSLQSLWA